MAGSHIQEALRIINSFALSTERLTQELISWSEINTHYSNKPGLDEMCRHLKEAFSQLSDSVETVSLPPLTKASLGRSTESSIPPTSILLAEKRTSAPLQIIFSGHYDTVFHPTSGFTHTQMIDTKTLKGPGVSDMKGGLLIMKETIRLIESFPSSIKDSIGWKAVITPDEEIGSPLSRSFFKNLIRDIEGKRALGIILEPTLLSGAFVQERPGSLTLFLTTTGKKAHAGRDYWSGRNALTALIDILFHLDEIFLSLSHGKETQAKTTLTIAELIGGEAANIVPDRASASINIRSQSMDDIRSLYHTLLRLIQDRSRDGISYSIHTESFRPPKIPNELHKRLHTLFETSSRDLTQAPTTPIEWSRSGGVSDGNILEWYGLPCLDGMGVTGGGLHTSEEWCEIETIPTRIRQLASFIATLSCDSSLSIIPPVAYKETDGSEKEFYSSPYHSLSESKD